MALHSAQKKRRPFQLETLEHRHLLTSSVVINEIHYDPPDKTQFSEFIELYNNTDAAIDLSGWQLENAVEFRIPDGTSIAARSYLVVAQDPATANNAFGLESLGPWSGQLRNSGETIELRNSSNDIVDEVDYQRGFPWPTVGDEPGHSIELINPNLENDKGGNWRRARTVEEGPSPILFEAGSRWEFFPGEQAPSSPATAWREPDFDDEPWVSRRLPVGYGDDHVQTELTTMRGNFSTVYFRRRFEIDDLASVQQLVFRAQFDDGINVFINGQNVVSENVSSVNASHTATAIRALENLEFVQFNLTNPSDYLVEGTNVIAVQLLNASLNGSSDAWFDAELATSGAFAGSTTAGGPNSVSAENAPPAARQVSHGDGEIVSGDDVVITTKVTDPDGVGAVTLQYHVVAPGDYFGRYLKSFSDGTLRLNPRYDDPTEWATVTLTDSGSGGDAVAGDDVYLSLIHI